MRLLWSGCRESRHRPVAVARTFLLVSALVMSAPIARSQTLELPAGVTMQDVQRELQSRGLSGANAPQRSPQSALDGARDPVKNSADANPRDREGTDNEEKANKDDIAPVEIDYQSRTSSLVRLFGYDFLAGSNIQAAGILTGSIPNDYIMGVGDELVVTLRGQVNRTELVRVDREGRIVLTDLTPLPVAGRSFEDVRGELAARIEATFQHTELFISLGSVRSVRVLVGGAVEKPGQLVLTSLSSVIDALVTAGGIQRNGSLRNVRLLRNGETTSLDIYDLLVNTTSALNLKLQDGDQIIVPPLGQTVAVIGDVVRSAIFEMGAPGTQLTVAEAMRMAGGPQRGQGNEIMVMRLDDAGRDRVVAVTSMSMALQPNDVVVVGRPETAIALEGAVRMPGERSVTRSKTLRTVLSSPRLLEADPYLLFAAVLTEDPVTRMRRYIPFSLRDALDGKFDMSLRANDRIIILSQSDIDFLGSDVVQNILHNRANQNVPPNCAGLANLLETVSFSVHTRFPAATRTMRDTPETATLAKADTASPPVCPPVFNTHPDMLPLTLEHATAVEGAVRRSGIFPLLPGTPLSEVLYVTKGFTLDADTSRLELSELFNESRSSLSLQQLDGRTMSPGDVLRVPARRSELEVGLVQIRGEVMYPGRYNIRRGEKLSDLMRRAGGLTEQSYVYGSIFTRERVRIAEQAAFDRAARELERSVPQALMSASGTESDSMRSALPALQALATSLRETPAVGRVMVEADPMALLARPEFDFVLEPGDTLFIPKRPAHVTLTGEVLNPANILFQAELTAKDYVRLAGGTTPDADLDSAFLILPNGEAVPLKLDSRSRYDKPLPPGSTIVVPRDLRKFDFLRTTTSVFGLVRDMAVTVASLVVLSN